MRLYLSSFRLGCGADVLPKLAGGAGRAAVIANATDGRTPDQRVADVQRELDDLEGLGLDAEQVDLRDYFDRDDIAERLAAYDLLWVRGGNVFTLRHALARSGADDAIVELLARDAVCYGGYSAGPCVLGGLLGELAAVDDAGEVTALYGEPTPLAGLGVLDWMFVPHVDSPGHPETEACTRLADAYERNGVPIRRFRDGDVLIVDGVDERTVRAP